MADKTIGELPVAEELYNDSLLVVEQQREARSIRGELVANFAREAAAADVQRAVDAAASAEKSADSAKTDADRAEEMRQSIELDYEYIDTARTEAQASAQAAGESQEKAKASEDAAKASQDAAKASETASKASQDAAAESERAAKNSKIAAEHSSAAAKESETAAETARDETQASKEAAAVSEQNASASAEQAGAYNTEAKSYAVGHTGSREGEDTDNAAYYYDQAKRISQGLAGALLPMGTITFEELKTQTTQAGYMYNISDDFITDDTFREGAGHAYPAGTNVYYTADGYWDCLAGAQVVSVNGRTGAVVLDKKDVGLGNVDNTADKDKNVASAAKLTTPRTINGVDFDGTKPITVYDDTKTSYLGIITDLNAAVDPRRDPSVCTYIWTDNTANSPYSQQLTPWSLGFGISFYSGSDWQMQYAWSIDGGAYMRNKVGSTAWSNWHKAILDAYPVGSYYLSSEPTSPASLFGGTWTQIEGRFILTAGGGYAAGSTGGAASVVSGGTALTVDQIAAHVHNFGIYTSASGSPTSAVTVGITGYADVSGQKSGLGMTDVAGGGQPHAHTVATMPPYIVAYCWRRVA